MTLPDVYESDRASAIICQKMTLRGFHFDRDRAALLKSHLRSIEEETLERGRELSGDPQISLNGGNKLKTAFFDTLNAPIYFRSQKTNEPSLRNEALAAYQVSSNPDLREMARLVKAHRNARKLRVTYLDNIESELDSESRVHVNWNQCGTVTGRWASRLMQMPNAHKDPTAHLGGIKSCFRASPGHTLVWFDAAQYEMRMAAYASGDPNMIEACESADLHSFNARQIYGEHFHPEHLPPLLPKSDERAKVAFKQRYLAKRSGLATVYETSPDTLWKNLVAEGENVSLDAVALSIHRTRQNFRVFFEWAHQNYLTCVRTGYVYSALLGRRRWLGHDPEIPKTTNHPVQAGAGDLMNRKMALLDARLDSRKCHPVAQVHDNGTFEVEDDYVEEAEKIMEEVWAEEVDISSSGTSFSVRFPIDRERGDRWK